MLCDRSREHRLGSLTALAGLVLLNSITCNARLDYTGLYGSYCASRYEEQRCCPGRQDECSVPILGTLCYCDTFCSDRDGEEDCCPDYRSYCHGDREPLPPAPGNLTQPIGECTYQRKRYKNGDKFKDNCNNCKCSALEEDSCKIMCENNECLMSREVIDRINRVEKLGWVARNYSMFWGRTLHEGLQLRTGTINPAHSIYRMNEPLRRAYNTEHLPREFDARVRWPDDVKPVSDQGWCGASWAVSSADVVSDRFAIMSKGAERVHLSAQQLVSCNSRNQQACHGGSLDRAWFFTKRFGLVDEKCYPWTGLPDRCSVPRKGKLTEIGCRSRSSYALRDEYYKVGSVYRLVNETDIMHEIWTSGPVQATMRVYRDFFNYESGVYVHSSLSEELPSGYHSVRVIGWGEDPSPLTGLPVKFWRVANSWGREWGEDGYFRIIRGTNECEIENFVVGAWAKTV
ncbi:uncharacterized peptidase C1-like protein F26E4.3 [Copidosoma floridanum]|uniref:uncharacterized peptidase C1-like protein F26E4.3 n=1 Tax=Copidosoma floridanum TaxID=29053 RepID=UPI0006C9A0C8|nr:uncharacterized peptidase C1-like protein F26E4.3 [Copidosoma floridanum]